MIRQTPFVCVSIAISSNCAVSSILSKMHSRVSISLSWMEITDGHSKPNTSYLVIFQKQVFFQAINNGRAKTQLRDPLVSFEDYLSLKLSLFQTTFSTQFPIILMHIHSPLLLIFHIPTSPIDQSHSNSLFPLLCTLPMLPQLLPPIPFYFSLPIILLLLLCVSSNSQRIRERVTLTFSLTPTPSHGHHRNRHESSSFLSIRKPFYPRFIFSPFLFIRKSLAFLFCFFVI